jgi:3-methyladenine DNA glycosylase AlkD
MINDLQTLQNEEKARILQRFFKTGPGQYGEGDLFLGITVPVLRKLAAKHRALPVESVSELLCHPYHEARLIALLLMIQNFRQANPASQKEIYKAYLAHTHYINNWDLVDLSAPHIVGVYLADKERSVLTKLAISGLLWERRIAVISTFHFIRNGEFKDTLDISDLLLADKEDLIHKAVGWMLREVGKRNGKVLEGFLRRRYAIMPRTMLRYAIEKFPEEKRRLYLTGSL